MSDQSDHWEDHREYPAPPQDGGAGQAREARVTRYVLLTCEQEALVTVRVPESATDEECREEALAQLDDSCGMEWETTGADYQVSDRPILPLPERIEHERRQEGRQRQQTEDARLAQILRRTAR